MVGGGEKRRREKQWFAGERERERERESQKDKEGEEECCCLQSPHLFTKTIQPVHRIFSFFFCPQLK